MNRQRFGLVIFFFILFFIFLEIRIFFISTFPDPRLTRRYRASVTRGTIYDRHNRELAVSSLTYSLYIRPSQLDENIKKQIFQYLIQSKIIQQNDIQSIGNDKSFAWIKRKMSLIEASPVKEMIQILKDKSIIKRDEIGLSPEEGRYYPFPATAGIVGFVGIDNTGLSGLELSMNKSLQQGYDVVTTIDGNLSTLCSEELKKGIIENKAESGSVVIINNKTREFLVIISFPDFDPNDLKSITSYNMHSRALSSTFEPGSIMKQFSAAYALEHKTLKPYYECTGVASVGDYQFTCNVPHGRVDLASIIQKSCNVGMIQVAESFRIKEYYPFLCSFGFGQAPELPLSESSPGILRSPDKWSFLSKYMISIGQEIGVTSVQLSIASSIIADNGKYRTPMLISKVLDSQSKNYYQQKINEYRIISPETSKLLLKMMEKVVSENGTALTAKIEGITVAGKTGTGQIAKEKGGGYYKDLFNAVFVGYIPAENPELTVVIVVHKPHGENHTGGLVAAPIFANIIRRMISSTTHLTSN